MVQVILFLPTHQTREQRITSLVDLANYLMSILLLITKLITLLLISNTVLAGPVGKTKPTSTFIQTHDVTLGKYIQYQTEDKPVDYTADIGLDSVFEFTKFKLTSNLYYSYSLTTPANSDIEDPILTLSSLAQNIFPVLKTRYYVVSTVGVSRSSRENQEQYGSLGLGISLILDSEYLKIPNFELRSSFSVSKAFQKTEYDSEGVSNNNYYTQYTMNASYQYQKWTFAALITFYQYFKYISDESKEIFFFFLDIGYQTSKAHNIGAGHSNRMGFYDENSGEVNVRVLNPTSSYFYIRYTYSYF